MFLTLIAAPAWADEATLCVQNQLQAFGYDPGPSDGVMGRRTRAAAEAFVLPSQLPLPDLSSQTAEHWCEAMQDFAATDEGQRLIVPADWDYHPRFTRVGGGFEQFSNSQSNRRYSAQLTGDRVRRGELAWRFEVRPGDCAGDDCEIFRERSELTANPIRQRSGQIWLAYSIYLAPDFRPQLDGRYTFGQAKPVNQPRGYDREMGQYTEPGLIYMDYERGWYAVKVISTAGTPEDFEEIHEVYNILPLGVMLGTWTDIVMVLDLDSDDRGFVVFANGQEVAAHNRPITNYDPGGVFFKFGIYRHFSIRDGRPAPGTFPTDVVYFDEVRVGRGREEVDPSINPDLSPVN